MRCERPVGILVVGGGASGALLVLQLLLRAEHPLRIEWIDGAGSFGPGLAYGGAAPWHLLNVPAARMSALPDRPRHFLAWCRAAGIEAGPGDFLPRRVWGRYLQDLLALAETASPASLIRRQAIVENVQAAGARWRVDLAGGGAIIASHVVLACGNLPPAPPQGSEAPLLSPWDAAALDAIDRDAAVLLLGTGLTMIDAVCSLEVRGHRGRLVALSRRGLLPRRHGPAGGTAFRPAPGVSLRACVRQVRAAIAAGPTGWRAVIDVLRPVTPAIWQGFSVAERRRFLRHLRPWWEVHRHRIPGPIAETIGGKVRRGELEIRAGRVVGLHQVGEGLDLQWRPRGGRALRRDHFDVAIACTGPAERADQVPFLRRLVEEGVARTDPVGLGIRTVDGVVAGTEGGPLLLALGPMCRGERFESTAIPEIRLQAVELADRLLHLVPGEPLAAGMHAGVVVSRLDEPSQRRAGSPG